MRINLLVIVFVLGYLSVYGQDSGKGSDGFFYDTLTIMDYTTLEASEMLSRVKKPMKRNFFLKTGGVNYSLFKGEVANLTSEQILAFLDSGFSLMIDRQEHQGQKNLKPSILEIIGEDDEVIETIEDLAGMEETTLKRKLTKDTLLQFSGFTISVNEKRLGPIIMDVKVVE